MIFQRPKCPIFITHLNRFPVAFALALPLPPPLLREPLPVPFLHLALCAAFLLKLVLHAQQNPICWQQN